MVEIKGVHNNSEKNSSKFSLMWLIPHTAQFVQALVHVVETHLEAGQPLSRVVCVLKFIKKQRWARLIDIEAVHLLASFASLEAKLSQLCSNVRHTVYYRSPIYVSNEFEVVRSTC